MVLKLSVNEQRMGEKLLNETNAKKEEQHVQRLGGEKELVALEELKYIPYYRSLSCQVEGVARIEAGSGTLPYKNVHMFTQ